MCEEKYSSAKVCNCCGNELPITDFDKDIYSKDGYENTCRICKIKSDINNHDLAKFTSQELIDELSHRGYYGTLKIYSTL